MQAQLQAELKLEDKNNYLFAIKKEFLPLKKKHPNLGSRV